MGTALLAVAVGACTADSVVCEPECTGATPFCDPLGRCVECLMDSDCPVGAPACASGANVCVECATSADCPGGLVCDDAVCVLDCPLPYGKLRNTGGGCDGCASDADCAAGTCRDGYCQLPCGEAPAPDSYCFLAQFESLPNPGCQLQDLVFRFDFGECPGTTRGMAGVGYCDPCYGSLGGCADCDVEGRCHCATDTDCPSSTVCDEGTCAHVECWEDEDCPCGQYCDGELCRLECATDADCSQGRCHAPSGRCLECLSDDDCPTGQRCYERGCILPCSIEPCDGARCSANGLCSGCGHLTLGVDPELAPSTACDP